MARDAAGYKRNTEITPAVLAQLKAKGIDDILVRSPLAGGPPDGVWARDLGRRDRSRLPYVGEMAGAQAAAAISEKLTQASLKARHTGGVAGASKLSGYALVDQLLNPPKTFRGGAAHAQLDGRVTDVREAPQGGTYISVGSDRHYAGHGLLAKMTQGDEVEAGDVLSDGIPNPAEIIRHKGIGEGRRYLTKALHEAYRESGIPAERRNIELVVRGLVDRVEASEPFGDYAPGDLISYNRLTEGYEPRQGHRVDRPELLRGQYIERPVLHYSLGTRVTPSVISMLRKYNVPAITTHSEPPPFLPAPVRAVDVIGSDEDWMTRMLGSNLKKGLLKSVHRGAVSDEAGTSYGPSLARGVDFASGEGAIKPFTTGEPGKAPVSTGPSIFQRLTGVGESAATLKAANMEDPFGDFERMYSAVVEHGSRSLTSDNEPC